MAPTKRKKSAKQNRQAAPRPLREELAELLGGYVTSRRGDIIARLQSVASVYAVRRGHRSHFDNLRAERLVEWMLFRRVAVAPRLPPEWEGWRPDFAIKDAANVGLYIEQATASFVVLRDNKRDVYVDGAGLDLASIVLRNAYRLLDSLRLTGFPPEPPSDP